MNASRQLAFSVRTSVEGQDMEFVTSATVRYCQQANTNGVVIKGSMIARSDCHILCISHS